MAPSAGGHWARAGPLPVPLAVALPVAVAPAAELSLTRRDSESYGFSCYQWMVHVTRKVQFSGRSRFNVSDCWAVHGCKGAGSALPVPVCWAGREESSFGSFDGLRPAQVASDLVDCYRSYCARETPVPDCYYLQPLPGYSREDVHMGRRSPASTGLPDHLPPSLTWMRDCTATPRPPPLEP